VDIITLDFTKGQLSAPFLPRRLIQTATLISEAVSPSLLVTHTISTANFARQSLLQGPTGISLRGNMHSNARELMVTRLPNDTTSLLTQSATI